MTSKNQKHSTFQGFHLDLDGDIANVQLKELNRHKGAAEHTQYSSLPHGNHPNSSVATSSVSSAVVPTPCQSNMELHHAATDMTGKMTPEGRRMLVRTFIKQVLFRRLKFFQKELHGMYDQRETSVCGLVIQSCHILQHDATLDWWAKMRKVVIATHTNHRNNVIKTMRLRFRGMCLTHL